MITSAKAFWMDEQGQDLIEYTLVMAFVSLVTLGFAHGVSGSVTGIWKTSNTTLAAAKVAAS
jgi:Flp pilus assembly pilin Flp